MEFLKAQRRPFITQQLPKKKEKKETYIVYYPIFKVG
jgi:hypothetical protein